MSYAEAAASGPKQSAAEARAPAPPVIEHREDTHTSSLIDVDSPHVISVPSDYDGETSTQAERREREFKKFERDAEEEFKKLQSKARKGEKKLLNNKDNPVVIANAALLGVGALALSAGAIYKYTRNELSGKLVGLWAAGLTAFAVGDFFTSQWLFKNKYPTK